MSPLVILIAAFVGVAALVGGVAVMLRSPSEEALDDRLAQFTGKKKPTAKSESILREGALAEALGPKNGFFGGIAARFGKMTLLFEQADTNLTTTAFFAISGILAAGGAVVAIIAGAHPSVIPIAAVCGGLLPLVWLFVRRRKRLKAFGAQLPDALELIARALRAGHSLAAGFQLVSTEAKDPIATEFGRVFEEQNLGIPLDEALESLTERIPNLDLRFFATAIILQRQTGGDLAEILDKIGRLIRERFKVWGQVQALTGEGRLSGVVLLALPPVLFLAVWKLNPDYVRVLFTDARGIKMLIFAAVMQFIGAVVIRKIVNIKV